MFTIIGIESNESSCVMCSKSGSDIYLVEGQGLKRRLCHACLKKIVKLFASAPVSLPVRETETIRQKPTTD